MHYYVVSTLTASRLINYNNGARMSWLCRPPCDKCINFICIGLYLRKTHDAEPMLA